MSKHTTVVANGRNRINITRAICFTLFVLLLSVSLPHGAVSLTAVLSVIEAFNGHTHLLLVCGLLLYSNVNKGILI